MTGLTHKCLRQRGFTLVEAVLAIGVLAVALPLVFGVLAEAGKCAAAAQAETRSTWIIPACMDEIRASRGACPQYFPAVLTGQGFPPPGGLWALGFSRDGQAVGKISRALYDRGTSRIDGRTICYIVAMGSSPAPLLAGAPAMQEVHLELEYPATAPAAQRRKLDFHTRLP